MDFWQGGRRCTGVESIFQGRKDFFHSHPFKTVNECLAEYNVIPPNMTPNMMPINTMLLPHVRPAAMVPQGAPILGPAISHGHLRPPAPGPMVPQGAPILGPAISHGQHLLGMSNIIN